MGNEKELLKQRIGIALLCLILVLSGILMIKGEAKQAKFEENVLGEQTETKNFVEKSNPIAESSKNVSENKPVGKVNINTASIEELDTLPGIGEKTAQKIIDYRKSHGGFKTLIEIKEVSGIGDAKYEDVKGLISI